MKEQEPKKEQSPSQKMRAILYRLWELDNEGFAEVEDFYKDRMKKMNEWLLRKLETKKLNQLAGS